MKCNNKLTELRKSENLTIEEMANRLVISGSFYHKIEIGERNPSYNFIKKLKKEFPHINIDTLFF